jgi:cytochrome c-type biogenesis protein CcmH
MRRAGALIAGLLWVASVFAIDPTVLPCMQCQNNSIADSPVGLAADLRRDVKEMLLAGKTDDEVREYMVQRYGDVILFRPPMKARTAWVWIAPMLVLTGGLLVGIRIVRRRAALVANDDSTIDTDDRPQ